MHGSHKIPSPIVTNSTNPSAVRRMLDSFRSKIILYTRWHIAYCCGGAWVRDGRRRWLKAIIIVVPMLSPKLDRLHHKTNATFSSFSQLRFAAALHAHVPQNFTRESSKTVRMFSGRRTRAVQVIIVVIVIIIAHLPERAPRLPFRLQPRLQNMLACSPPRARGDQHWY